MKKRGLAIKVFALTVLFSACKRDDDPQPVSQVQQVQPTPTPTPTPGTVANYSSKAAVEWMNECYKLVKVKKLSPPVASRVYAYSGIALYESVVNGMPGYKSLGGQLNEMPKMPVADTSKTYDWPTVMNSAMSSVLRSLLNTDASDITNLYNKQLNERIAAGVEQDVIMTSEQYGKQVADAIIAYSNKDGFTESRTKVYMVPVRDVQNWWVWAPTSQTVTTPLEPFWGTLRPYCMATSGACYIKSAVPLDSARGSVFFKMADSVRAHGGKNSVTAENKKIAEYWADGVGTATPPGHWISIGGQVAGQRNLNLQEAAKMYALLGIACGESFISCWEAKYKENLLRPETYIKSYIDPNWEPVIPTPPFPEYSSGHSVVSGACSYVLTYLYGSVAFTDTTNQSMGRQPRSFNSFAEAADEAARSRFYGGIHYPEAINTGLKQGKLVGEAVRNKAVLLQ